MKLEVAVNTDQLQDLLSSFSTLRTNHRLLLDRLRGSIDELRQLRQGLQQLETGRRNWHRPNRRAGAFDQNGLIQDFGLTRREAQVAKLLSQGRSNQAIARELSISEHTARHHTQSILSKLEVHSRGEAGAKIRG
jgi:two-component system response regulator DegU